MACVELPVGGVGRSRPEVGGVGRSWPALGAVRRVEDLGRREVELGRAPRHEGPRLAELGGGRRRWEALGGPGQREELCGVRRTSAGGRRTSAVLCNGI